MEMEAKKIKTVKPAEPVGQSHGTAKDANEMAVERTLMAADRSLMAWVRTGLSLISFGFTIYKFLDIQDKQLAALGKTLMVVSSPKVVGLLMIGLGILSLVLGTIENLAIFKNYRLYYNVRHPRYSLFITGIITTIGIILFLGITFNLSGLS
jgi:putative membrane protein